MVETNHISNLTIEEIVHDWPQVAPLFQKYHLRCIGCSMEKFDTLIEALRIHHVSPQIFLHELELLIQSTTTADFH